MSKKIIYLVLGALFIFGVLFLLWSWFFSSNRTTSQNNGQFGTASDTSQTAGNGGNTGNGQIGLGQNGGANGSNNGAAGSGQNATNGQIPLNGNSTGGANGTGGTNGTNGTNGAGGTGATLANGGTISLGTGTGSVSPTGVIWTGSSNVFTPADINSVNGDAGGFTPTITSTPNNGSSGTTLVEALAATAIAGSLTCALQAGVVTISGTGASTVAGTTATPPAVLAAGNGPLFVADVSLRASANAQGARNTGKDSVTFQQCLINVIAKVALQQITVSVVNWINSGFNGQPSFVNNFEQFFTNVADLAAGQFIKGSALSFLCSPFQLQIKIAIAQSYANRNAQSCSLTGIIKNVNNFMNGSFSQGGWPGFVQFTTVPTNNPYGAFAYAQVGLSNAQSQAQANAKNNISPTGFLNLQKITCTDGTSSITPNFGTGINSQAAIASGKSGLPTGCKATVVTPGGAIADSLGAVSKSGVDQLGLASDIDQIISALTTQLMTKILQNGLTSLSQSTTQTPADLAAQQQAASLLIDMQSHVVIAQQIGSIDQASIGDIENTQSNLNNLVSCWSSVAAQSTTNSANAAQQAANASSTLLSLNAQIEQYNNDITTQNAVIASLSNFESQVSAASTQADVANVNASYSAAVSAGSFPSQTDVTTVQQNRTTLQSQLAALNLSTQSGLQQCQATH